MQLARIRRLAPHAPALPRALFELVRARFRLAHITPQHIIERNRTAAGQESKRSMDASSRKRVACVAYLIPRLAARVPWRSDCLVQAIAAQDWLAELGIASTISIGVDRDDGDKCVAHAWLTCEEAIVTGGAVERYAPLLGPASKFDSLA